MIFDLVLDFFRGKAVTVPPLDGAFRPNRKLDEAIVVAALDAPSDLVAFGDDFLIADGNCILRITRNDERSIHATYPAAVTAMAASSDGRIAIALASGEIRLADGGTLAHEHLNCITALSFGADGSLFIANGSSVNAAAEWKRDLMEKRSCGSIWRLSPAGQLSCVIDKLAWPQGLLPWQDGLIVSESWRRRLILIDVQQGRQSPALVQIPGYPGRLSQSAGGALLSVFAPVNRLIELVLQEDAYRVAMLGEVDPAYWIAPSYCSGRTFLEPLQCGAIKTMGVRKPWAPSRSYGLIVRLDGKLRPVESWHSRADGQRHGIIGALESADGVYALSAGAGVLLRTAPGD